MKLSNMYFYTLRENIQGEDSTSGQLLSRAGMIRKVGAGIFSYTPMGLKVLRKIENIIREEMDASGAQEVLMPALIPTEVYEESGRLENFGASMFRLKDRFDKEYALGPTHEELFTKMAYAQGNSYKNLPVTIYQIQTKFRDEARPRYGLIRVREFAMKDAYSFDVDNAGLDISYKKMYDAYKKAFDRMGLTYKIIKADTGVMGGELSEEFQAVTDIGEDTIVTCDSCDFASNIEVASCLPSNEMSNDEMKDIEKINTPNIGKIEDLVSFTGMDIKKMVKSLICTTDEGKVVMCLIRADRELNDTKVRKLLGATNIELAEEDIVVKVTNAKVGFAGPIGLGEDVDIIVDDEVKNMKNFLVGANESDYHYLNVNLDRDFKATMFGDIKNIQENDVCPICGGKIKYTKGVEIGNTFKLGTKYSKALNCLFTDSNNELKPYVMGCYGIGVGRCLACVVEQHNDENGIIWPEEVAPFDMAVVPVNMKDEEQVRIASQIYDTLKQSGIDVLLDDRSERAGVKFKDIELIGIPKRIVVGKRATEGIVEYRERTQNESIELTIEEAINKILAR